MIKRLVLSWQHQSFDHDAVLGGAMLGGAVPGGGGLGGGGRGMRGSQQEFELALQPGRAGADHGQREAEPVRNRLRAGLQGRVAGLGQPHHAPVVAEVVRPQLRVAVQAEPGEHGPAEAADQEIGQHVGARLGFEQRRHPVRPGQQVVAVQPGQPPQPQAAGQLVQRPVGAAVRVADRHRQPAGLRRHGQPLDLRGDRGGPVVQQRGQAVQFHRPAPAGGDLPDGAAQRPAGDDHRLRRLSRGRPAGR